MSPDKAPRLDGITGCFYKSYWEIIGNDVSKIILGFFNEGEQLRVINHTNLVLILKKKSPNTPKDFHPISLCNVVYKIISKELVNMLKGILPYLTDESQNAFIRGRLIFDNILVAHETIHSIKSRRYRRTSWLAMKLDMSKAYDRIEWDYLKGVLRTLGFSERWIGLIMACVRIVASSVVINEK